MEVGWDGAAAVRDTDTGTGASVRTGRGPGSGVLIGIRCGLCSPLGRLCPAGAGARHMTPVCTKRIALPSGLWGPRWLCSFLKSVETMNVFMSNKAHPWEPHL